MNKSIIYFAIGVLVLNISCRKNDDDPSEFTNGDVSYWIYQNMKYVYFWEDYIPGGLNALTQTDPESFFYSLLYDTEDKWSYISSDYESFEAELSGVPESMGYSPAFGKFRESDNVFIIVEYVYDGSPADIAGLKRGDIILTINGAPMTIDNYDELYSQSSYTAGLGTYTGSSIVSSGESISLTAEIITTDPVLHYEILDPEGSKIGYLAYSQFISGESNEYLQSLESVFGEFLTAGINNLIVDLRYNPGGMVTVANYIASSIAPASVVAANEILISLVYNDFLTDDIHDYYGSESDAYFNERFSAVNYNLNLSDVYFLTTQGTASASELVITGLDPYMNVTIVGDSTYGKYTGAWVIPDTETPPRHNWAIIPIVMKYSNAEGVSDFKNGLIPDYYVPDNLFETYEFGDTNDPLLRTAIDLINGTYSAKKSLWDKPYQDLPKSSLELLKYNAIIDRPKLSSE